MKMGLDAAHYIKLQDCKYLVKKQDWDVQVLLYQKFEPIDNNKQ